MLAGGRRVAGQASVRTRTRESGSEHELHSGDVGERRALALVPGPRPWYAAAPTSDDERGEELVDEHTRILARAVVTICPMSSRCATKLASQLSARGDQVAQRDGVGASIPSPYAGRQHNGWCAILTITPAWVQDLLTQVLNTEATSTGQRGAPWLRTASANGLECFLRDVAPSERGRCPRSHRRTLAGARITCTRRQ